VSKDLPDLGTLDSGAVNYSQKFVEQKVPAALGCSTLSQGQRTACTEGMTATVPSYPARLEGRLRPLSG
jgi:hypothetical protein